MKISTLIYISLGTVLLLAAAIFFYIHFIVEKRDLSKVVSEVQELRPRRIVAFGDSLTYGYGLATIDDSYPSQLQKKLLDEGYSYKVINLGVSGETSGDGLNRLATTLSFEPDLVLLEFGANDAFQKISPDITRSNMREIIRVLDEKKIKIILLNVEQSPLVPVANSEEFGKILPELAKEYGLPIIPSFLRGMLFNADYMQADGIHPKAEGYSKILNEYLWPVLKPQLVKQVNK
jgi:acyl-CoA thioesterase I